MSDEVINAFPVEEGDYYEYEGDNYFYYHPQGKNFTVEINNVNFPDDNFRKYISENLDSKEDGIVKFEDISKIERMHLDDLNISDLKGIEYFTYLVISLSPSKKSII